MTQAKMNAYRRAAAAAANRAAANRSPKPNANNANLNALIGSMAGLSGIGTMIKESKTEAALEKAKRTTRKAKGNNVPMAMRASRRAAKLAAENVKSLEQLLKEQRAARKGSNVTMKPANSAVEAAKRKAEALTRRAEKLTREAIAAQQAALKAQQNALNADL